MSSAEVEAIVNEACEYYRDEKDLRVEDFNALQRIYPHLETFKKVASLCDSDSVRLINQSIIASEA